MKNSFKITCITIVLSCAAIVSCTGQTQVSTSNEIETSAREISTLGDGGVSNFYRTSVEKTPNKAGVLVKQEPHELRQSVPGAAENIRVLYTSTNGLDQKSIVTVSGSVFLPQGKAPEGGWPVVLWSHGTVGIADVCAPSWTGYAPFHDKYLKQWLDQGYAIAASDYQGLGTKGIHPYLATQPAAYSNLDMLRAIKGLKVNLSDKVVVIGQSQGAGAAIATAAYAPQYAPELNLLGVVATGVPFFSPKILELIQKNRPQDKVDPMLGYNFLMLTLVEELIPDFSLTDYVFDSIYPTVRSVSTVCNEDMRGVITEKGLTFNKIFKKSPLEPLKVAIAQMNFPTLKIDTPIFIGTGALDRDTPPKMQAIFAKKACAAGTNIQAHLYPGFEHRSVLNHSTVDSIPFVKTVMSGGKVEGNCQALPY